MSPGHSLPPGKNQSACWMSGSMMPTICSDSVVIISVMFLQGDGSSATPAGRQDPGRIPAGFQQDPSRIPSRIPFPAGFHSQQDPSRICPPALSQAHPSACGHSRLGPSTMATLLGVILFMSWYSVSLARNLITYLESRSQRGQCHPLRVPSPCPAGPRLT